jgi:hypothetical protein
MKSFKFAILLSMAVLGDPVAANDGFESAEVTGSLQQWVVGSRTLMMNGKTYQLMDEAEFLSADLQLAMRSLFKPGVRIMLRISNDRVTHIVLNPTYASQFDQPNR